MKPQLRLAALSLAACAVGGTAPPPLAAARWTDSGSDIARILTHQPPECLRPARSPDEAYLISLGRAAFRTPLLLGGQAARLGLRCESCHRNGRTNPHFHFPGLSGAPGTADVTSFMLSSHRGDHIDNPRPIPDLGGPKTALRVDQGEAGGALEGFIRGLVMDEFDGPPPPPAVLRGLAAYVRAMAPAACADRAEERVTLEGDLRDVAGAVAAAREGQRRGDRDSAILMLQAARTRLGDIAERLRTPQARAQLQARSRSLGDSIRALRSTPIVARARIAYRPPRIGTVIDSFYDPESIRAELAR